MNVAVHWVAIALTAVCFSGCGSLRSQKSILDEIDLKTEKSIPYDFSRVVVVSGLDQKMTIYDSDRKVREFVISTAKKGFGEELNSSRTPRGLHAVSTKIGAGFEVGRVFEFLEPTNEIIPGIANDRPVVITRILRLDGLESTNSNTFERLIYIHGSPVVDHLGTPDSGGCIRLTSDDVIKLFNFVSSGTLVYISERSASDALEDFSSVSRKLLARHGAATLGDRGAQKSLCLGYGFGIYGVPRNQIASIGWCAAAAKNNDVDALSLLATQLENNVTQTNIAVALHTLASVGGSTTSQLRLAQLLGTGEFGQQGIGVAIKSLEKSLRSTASQNQRHHASSLLGQLREIKKFLDSQ